MKVYLMSSINLGGFGEYSYRPLTLDEVSNMLRDGKFISAVRYQWDADVLRDLLGIHIPINRNRPELGIGDAAVVVELPEPDPSGMEMERRPRCIGLITRTA